jgi:hypothetical protein
MNTSLITNQEIEKINTITILDESKKQELMNAAPFASIPYMPMTYDFIEKYVLNDTEYPLLESKVSQAAIELKSRINRIVDAQFNIDKALLDIKELELDIEDIKNSQLSMERIEIQVSKKELEIRQKKWLINNYKNDSETNFNELTQWKKTIDDCLQAINENDPTITDFTKIPYEKIRMAEMQLKIHMWKQQQKSGKELTPSQKALVGE